MVRTATSQTLVEDVYDSLRNEVLGGLYRPGAPLRPAAIAVDYGVGAGVVREALARLAEQGLLDVEPNRGFRVISLDRRRVRDLVALRRIIDCAALREAVADGDIDWEGRVVAAHHALAGTSRRQDPDERSAAHRNFHLALLSGCSNERLVALCADLFVEAELYRKWSVPADAKDLRAGHRAREHRALRDAALRRDADRLVALHVEHLQRTADLALNAPDIRTA